MLRSHLSPARQHAFFQRSLPNALGSASPPRHFHALATSALVRVPFPSQGRDREGVKRPCSTPYATGSATSSTKSPSPSPSKSTTPPACCMSRWSGTTRPLALWITTPMRHSCGIQRQPAYPLSISTNSTPAPKPPTATRWALITAAKPICRIDKPK